MAVHVKSIHADSYPQPDPAVVFLRVTHGKAIKTHKKVRAEYNTTLVSNFEFGG